LATYLPRLRLRCPCRSALLDALGPWWARSWPEGLALLKAALGDSSPIEALLFALLLRASWVMGEVIHGAGHTLARALVDQSPGVLRLENVLEHRSPGELARRLLPFGGIAGAEHPEPAIAWLAAGHPDPWKVRIKAATPLLLHLIVLAGACHGLHSLTGSDSAPSWWLDLLLATAISQLGLLLASRTDRLSLHHGQAALLYCGNFGLLAQRETAQRSELLSPQAIRIFHQMGRDTELRGAQAGGGLVMAVDRQGDHGFVGHKIVNAKRGDLTPSLEMAFRHQRQRARRSGWSPSPTGLMACWHYRFGTSGPPAVAETHWQEWTPGRHGRLWRLDRAGRWSHQWQRVHHRITHNGDFEAFAGFGGLVDVGASLGPWLEEALQQKAPAVVDSARIAGMMDLLICQGDWFAAVRWATLRAVASFPDTTPSDDLVRWASLFEAVFCERIETGVGPQHLAESMAAPLEVALGREPRLQGLSREQRHQWIHQTVALFLYNDPATAVRHFLQDARGSFGLMVASTTWPDRLVLSSLGQPITIGGDPEAGLTVYASESAAVDGVLQERPGSWRIDLDENAGEVSVLSSTDLQISSLSLQRILNPQELQARRQFYRTFHRSPSRRSPTLRLRRAASERDPVAADLADIPSLLATIYDDWSNPGSANRQSADSLGQLLIAKAANVAEKERLLTQAGLAHSLARSSEVDLLVTGVENSLWLAEQFARDLTSLMPRLTVRAVSANEVLKALQNDIHSLQLARQTIVMVLSHSGRTFPSRQVMEACDLMVRRQVIREFFIVIGEPDSLLGSLLLKPQHPGEAFSRRLLQTFAGRRRAEPATASVAAMHQTLTQLLFSLSRQLCQAFPNERMRPLGMPLSRQQLERLESSETDVLLQECREILGFDGQGRPQPTPTWRHLVQAGRRWALHVLETPLAWVIHALYILITLELRMPLVQGVVRSLMGEAFWTADTAWATALRELALSGDITVYILGPWFWTLALRCLQRRPLLARTGRRTLVIGESSWVHPLLTNYISKLFSLSFGIASVDVQGGEVSDHLLHTHAHRLVRGTLLFLGVPDGRSGGMNRADADAAILTARQSDGIRHWNVGPEIVAVGTDPTLRSGPFQRALLLPCRTTDGNKDAVNPADRLIETLRESRYIALRRLLASYVFFWAMARDVGLLPLLRFKWWRSQSRTRVMTTAAPVSAARLDLAEEQEVAALALETAGRDQS
jgi:hypothetical protein